MNNITSRNDKNDQQNRSNNIEYHSSIRRLNKLLKGNSLEIDFIIIRFTRTINQYIKLPLYLLSIHILDMLITSKTSKTSKDILLYIHSITSINILKTNRRIEQILFTI